MFFFLGLPLTGIQLLCRYITVPVVMMVIQGALILKEAKFIKEERFPKVLRKTINPIIMDSVVVLYACALAMFMQCTQSIAVLITCAIVELAVHWWTRYKLAKKEDVLQEISFNCLSNDTEQN
jgi:phosphatidylserine synthase